MKFNIQMFAEEADNAIEIDEDVVNDEEVIDDIDTEDADGNETIIDEGENEDNKVKDETKRYAQRLKDDREKIRLDLEKEHNEKLNGIAKSRGFDSWEELEEYSETEKLERLGVTDKDQFKDLMEDLISKNPTVKEAKLILERQKEEDKNNYIKSEVIEISKIDADIKTFDDLTKLDRYEDFKAKLDKGYSLSDAYKLIYFDKIKNKDVDSVKQDAILKLDSKSHLKTNSGGSSKEIHVPSDIMEMYKRNTHLSDDEIRKHYAKTIGGNE